MAHSIPNFPFLEAVNPVFTVSPGSGHTGLEPAFQTMKVVLQQDSFGLHSLFEVAVGAVYSYSELVQVLSFAHFLSLYKPGATV